MAQSDEVTPEIVDYRVRSQIIWYLECASSPEKQRAYEKGLHEAGAPGSVPVEMIEQWADWVRTKGDSYDVVAVEMYTEPVFSIEEQAAIQQFHATWYQTADDTPDPMPCMIEELIGTPVWDRFNSAASEALAVFMRRGHLLERAKFDLEDQV